MDLTNTSKNAAITFCVYFFAADVIKPQYHVLRRVNDRLTIRWRQNIIRRHH